MIYDTQFQERPSYMLDVLWKVLEFSIFGEDAVLLLERNLVELLRMEFSIVFGDHVDH